ncbi:MAG: aminoglycoside 6-adenylyltransferase [Candidatus Izemoplasmatales bacterium]|nr:aminoglycoside 6-adenylyltransferase [Candidatus Izemoplasmatales bacterium]
MTIGNNIYNKILNIAKTNDNVRVVEMNGSRVNPNIEPDQYQDFDIAFYVANYDAFLRDESWMKDLGDVILSQTTLDQRESDNLETNSLIYMLQFRDGSRLDLSIVDVKKINEDFKQDTLSKILLDKDGYNLHDRQDESDYYVKKMTRKEFHYCTNEFFWSHPMLPRASPEVICFMP